MFAKRFAYLGSAAGLLIAAFIWPTLYSYRRLNVLGENAWSSVRINRVTGRVQAFDGFGWTESEFERPGRWLRHEELNRITGDAGFSDAAHDPLSLEALRAARELAGVDGPFAGRLYNGTAVAIERLNLKVTCKRADGGTAREAIYSITQRIDPLTVKEFSIPVLRCDGTHTVDWSVQAAYGHDVENVRPPQKQGERGAAQPAPRDR